MKIDMLSMAMNFTGCEDIKLGQENNDFFKVLNTKIENAVLEEGLNLELEEDMDDDLIAIMSSIINNLGLMENNQKTLINLEVVKDAVAKVEEAESNHLEKLTELFSDNEIEEFFNGLNLDLNELGLNKEQKNQLFIKLIKKMSEVNETTDIDREVNINVEDLNKLQDESLEGSLEYRKVMKSLEGESKDKLFEVGTFKHRNIIVEEKPSNPQGELSLLNRIAFSSGNFTESPKEASPVVVRNEFLGSDILKVVKYISNNRIEELNVKITPRELGEVSIKLLKTEDNNELIITLTNKKAYELIKENVTDIEKHLVSLDIKIKEVVVQVKNEVYSDFSGSFNEEFSKNNSREERKNNFSKDSSSFEEEEKTKKPDESNINLLV